MQTQVRPPRQRSSGGRTLMLLGLVLALAAAAIVFYITSSVQGTLTQTVSVVAAKVDIPAGTILTLNTPGAPYMRIQDAFVVKAVDKNLAPPNAFVFVNQDALNTALNNQVVKQGFLTGDVLRNNDPRLAAVGTTSGTSLTNINPSGLKDGQVLYILGVNNADIGVQPGDTIAIIATNATGSQITLPSVPVYAVDVPAKGKIIVVLSYQDAVYMAELEHGGYTLTIVIRKPNDATQPTTQPVDPNAINTRWFGKG